MSGFATALLQAIPVPPTPIPVSRLVANLTQYIAKNPGDVNAVYTLGRVHYFAFAGATDTLNTFRSSSPVPELYDFGAARSGSVRSTSKEVVGSAARISHLQEALTHLTSVVTGKPGSGSSGRATLTLACVYEEGGPFAEKLPARNGVAATGQSWRDAAIRYYGEAFDRTVASDSATSRQPMWGLDTLVSIEAGRSYVRLLDGRSNLTEDQRARISRIREHTSRLSKLPPGPVTPLIFTFDNDTSLQQLMADKSVAFDLNGTHLPQRYYWLKPNAAVLVWDPDGSGHITTGRQLFGSVTWWMFWSDAYQALAALDDDASGWLEGAELAGLAVWLDRDQDGVSDRGEVVAIADTPIAAIAAHASGMSGVTVMNARGLRLKDGRELPTWDWIAEPAPQPRRTTTDSRNK
jgi:hypothetical protein